MATPFTGTVGRNSFQITSDTPQSPTLSTEKPGLTFNSLLAPELDVLYPDVQSKRPENPFLSVGMDYSDPKNNELLWSSINSGLSVPSDVTFADLFKANGNHLTLEQFRAMPGMSQKYLFDNPSDWMRQVRKYDATKIENPQNINFANNTLDFSTAGPNKKSDGGWLDDLFDLNPLTKVPGSVEAGVAGLIGGLAGKYSWDPYGDEVSVGDVWGGGTVKSQDPEAREYGRAIGTAIGLYGAGSALGAAGSSGEGAAVGAAGDASFVGPATGSLAPSTATTTVSAAPGISSAGITMADLAAYGGTAGALANASNYGNSSGNNTNNTPSTYNPFSGLLNNFGTKEAVALGGGLLGSLNGAEKAGTTTTTQAPWSPQQPYLLDAFEKAKQASQGNALTQQANANYQSVLGGPTVNPMLGMDNPYLTSAINNANYDVNRAFMPAMNQANRASGSYGNSGVADVYSKNMLDAYSHNATNMRMTDYTNQQNLQQQAVNNTLGFTNNANTYNAQPAQQYAQTVQGSYGGSKSEPYYTNPYANVIGGLTTGLGLYNAYTGSK